MKGFLHVILVLPLAACSAEAGPSDAAPPALGWFERQGVEIEAFKTMPVEERGKRLTQAVYAFCESGGQTGSMDDLFSSCVTACGGYSYVLRGLLEATGAETRYANFYNIPNQGNHTGVELKIGDRWGYLDPTFGAYFTTDGHASGKLMSLREVAYGAPVGALGGHVLQAPDEVRPFAMEPLRQLFGLPFEHRYMKLTNYQVAERIGNIDGGTFLSLDIPLEVRDGGARIGGFGSTDATDADWLDATNATLNDDDPVNDTSFNAGLLLNAGGVTRMTTVSAYGMRPGMLYNIRLAFRSGSSDGKIEISGVGKGVRFPSPTPIRVVKGKTSVWETAFTPLRQSVQFQIRNTEQGNSVFLRGVMIAPAD